MPAYIEITAIYRNQRQRWDDTVLIDCELVEKKTEPAREVNGETNGHANMLSFSRPSAGATDDPFSDFSSYLTIKTEADEGELKPGIEYRFLGRYYDHPKYGKQFHAKSFTRATPHGKQGIIRYLVDAPWIGHAYARKLWDTFGGDAVRTLREQPMAVAAAVGLIPARAEEAARWLEKEKRIEDCKIALTDLLGSRGFPKGTPRLAIKQWGNAAADVIRKNPYWLMIFRGCGFAKTDKLYKELGHDLTAIKRQALCAWYGLASDQEGHTWQSEGFFIQKMRDRISGTKCDPKRAFAFGRRAPLGAPMLAGRRDENGRVWFAEGRRARNEETVAEKIRQLVGSESVLWPDVSGIDASEHQVQQLVTATRKNVGCFTGTPGTGKTRTAAQLVDLIIDNFGDDSIAVAAPTGKAAVRITEAMNEYGLDIKARTIHSLLGVASHSDGGGWGFEHGEKKPLPYEFILCDECFAPGTLVDTNIGQVKIENIKPGDTIQNAWGLDQVIATKKTEVSDVAIITFGKEKTVCSTNHPFFTKRGWVIASELRPDDSLVQTATAMRLLRGNALSEKSERCNETFLQHILQHEMVDAISGVQKESVHQRTGHGRRGRKKEVLAIRKQKGSRTNRTHSKFETNIQPKSSKENLKKIESHGPQAANSRRQWQGDDRASIQITFCSGDSLDFGACCVHENAQGKRIPNLLQAGPGKSIAEDWYRNRRIQSQCNQNPGQRQKENGIPCFTRVESVEILKSTDTRLDQYRDADGKLYFYDLQAARHPSFSVNGSLVHNCSMIDIDLMAALLRACAVGTHLLFVGDTNQLAPVGHGAPLRDFIAAGVPTGELTEIWRNAGSIVKACQAIRYGRRFEVDHALNPASGKNLTLLETRDGEGSANRILAAIRNIRDKKLADPIWDCQIIVAVNEKSPLSRKVMNRALQNELNPYGRGVKGSPFRVDDKIICLKNGRMPLADTAAGLGANINSHPQEDDWFDNQNEAKEAFVANGEIGRVLEVEAKRTIAEFSNPRRVIVIPRGGGSDSDSGEGNGDSDSGCNFDLGYAISCHKSQGSEWPIVIIALDEYPGAKMVCSREWIYTGFSRAKWACFLVGKLHTAHQMCRQEKLSKRKTFLRELLLAAGAGEWAEIKQEQPERAMA